MRIAIIHLSDIHFQASSNALVSRADRIVAAIRPTLQGVQGLVVAVTGDVAFSGSQSEYQIAFDFFRNLQTLMESEISMPVQFLFIPGNHDCNFGSGGDVRPALLETLSGKIETLDPSGEMVGEIAAVQDNFFAFEARLSSKDEIPKSDRLRYRTNLRIGQYLIVFDCYNTAWMSRKEEQQGTLLFPARLLTPEAIGDEEEPYLTVSLLHHRDNWLEANNARLLRDYVETYSDVILSGHEHVGAAYRKTKPDGSGAQYVEGAVLQDSRSPGNSGFNVLELDLDLGLRTSGFRWSGPRYSCETEGQWTKLERGSRRNRFQIATSYLKLLRDPGTGFIHPAKPDLTLDDLFVYPDLLRKSLRKLVKSSSSAKVVPGRDVVRFVAESKNVMISGPDDSGRTSLAYG